MLDIFFNTAGAEVRLIIVDGGERFTSPLHQRVVANQPCAKPNTGREHRHEVIEY